MFPIQIDIRQFRKGAATYRRELFEFSARLGSMQEPLWESIDRVVRPSIGMNFLMGGRPKWAPLAHSTFVSRGALGPILIRNGTLVRGATSRGIWKVTDTEADMEGLDSKVAYAKFHQTGTQHMPKREFAILQPIDIRNIEIIFDQWVARQAPQGTT